MHSFWLALVSFQFVRELSELQVLVFRSVRKIVKSDC